VFFFQAEDGIRDSSVTGVQTCALPICILGIMSSTFDIETGILCWLCRRLRLIERPECMVRRFAASKSGVTAWSAHEPPLILATRKVRQRIPSNRSIVQ